MFFLVRSARCCGVASGPPASAHVPSPPRYLPSSESGAALSTVGSSCRSESVHPGRIRALPCGEQASGSMHGSTRGQPDGLAWGPDCGLGHELRTGRFTRQFPGLTRKRYQCKKQKTFARYTKDQKDKCSHGDPLMAGLCGGPFITLRIGGPELGRREGHIRVL